MARTARQTAANRAIRSLGVPASRFAYARRREERATVIAAPPEEEEEEDEQPDDEPGSLFDRIK